jgi:FixJ family two-component response regulator
VTLGERALDCGIAILDMNLESGSPGGLDVYRWLKQQGFAGRIVFLSGYDRSHPLVAATSRLPGVEILQKPVPFEALIELFTGDGPSLEDHV